MRRAAWIVVCGALMGCAGVAKDLARDVTPSIVDGAVEGMSQPEHQHAIADAIQETAVRKATRRVTSGMVDGTLDALEEQARKERLAAVAGAFEVAAQRAVQTSVDNTLDTALGAKTEARLRAMMRGIVSDMVVTVISTAGAEFGSPEERLEAMGKSVREISRQATHGFQDALDDARKAAESGEIPKGSGSVLAAAGNVADSGPSFSVGLIVALALLLVSVMGMSMWIGRKFKVHNAEIAERDATLLMIAEAIKSTETEPWAGSLQRALKDKLRDHVASDHLRTLLRTHSHLRLSPTDKAVSAPADDVAA
jgi:flagellar basal body-associated protein FliL